MDLYEFLDMEKIPSLWDTDEGKRAIKLMVKEAKKIAKESYIEHEKMKLNQTIKTAIDLFNKNTGLSIEEIVFDCHNDFIEMQYIEESKSIIQIFETHKTKPEVLKNGKPIDSDEARELLRKALNEEPKDIILGKC